MLERICAAVWGWPTLLLFLCCAVVFTVRTGFLQLSGMKDSMHCFFGGSKKAQHADVSAFQSVCTALAASIGTGNIVGVCVALSVGGPGAVFWMCLSAFLGEATGYAENYLGVLYREKDSHGKWRGGAMYTLRNGLRSVIGSKAAHISGLIYAGLCVVSALGMGNAVQVNTAAVAVEAAFGVSPYVTGFLCAVLTVVLMYKGRASIAKLTEKIVPVSCFVFFTACIAVLIKQMRNLPMVFLDILRSAFGVRSIGGGFSASILRNAMLTGVRRGIFSNEAGLGTSVCAHAAVDGVTPHEQGLRSMAEIFIDTVVMCTLTALCVLSVPGAVQQTPEKMYSFALSALFGDAAGKIVSVCLAMFAFSTLIGWSFFGNESICFMFGNKGTLPFVFLYGLIAFVGSIIPFDFVWAAADLVNAMLAFLNLPALLLLANKTEKPKIKSQLLTS